MRTEWKLFTFLGLFMLPLGIVYWFTSYEEAGSLLICIVAVAFCFIGIYLLLQSRRMDGLRPEDYDALPSDGEGEVGSFPVGSIWPFVGALGATFLGYGVVFTGFLAVPGGIMILMAVIGMARESSVAEIGHLDFNHNTHDAEALPTFSDQVKK